MQSTTFNKDREGQNTGEKLGQYADAAIHEGEKRLKGVTQEAQKKFREGQEQISGLVSNIDNRLHENPWPIVAGVAAGALFIGYIMGCKR